MISLNFLFLLNDDDDEDTKDNLMWNLYTGRYLDRARAAPKAQEPPYFVKTPFYHKPHRASGLCK